ncbi:inositol-pentakisphosphate 2-kinase, partial [Paragonimus westermani]
SVFDLEKLTYCGEGNRTIVVSNTAVSLCIRLIIKYFILQSGWILRIRKSDETAASSVRLFSVFIRRLLYFIAWWIIIFKLFIYASSVFSGPVHSSIFRLTVHSQNDYRLTKGVDLSEPCVIAAPDAAQIPVSLSRFTYGPTISVEIKPKFGAFPLWPAAGSVNLIKTSASLFCLRQHHSRKLSRWRQPSLYCPCDMFSGCTQNGLMRPPTNKFAFSEDSEVIFSHEQDRLDWGLERFFFPTVDLPDNVNGGHSLITSGQPLSELVDRQKQKCKVHACPFVDHRDRLVDGLLVDALLHEFDSVKDFAAPISLHSGDRATFSMDCKLHKEVPLNGHLDEAEENRNGTSTHRKTDLGRSHHELDTLSPLPPVGSILDRILAVQLLSRDDICFIVSHFERVCKYLTSRGLTWDAYMQPPSKCFVPPTDLAESFDIVERYLIALVARDCSIMITFRRATPDCPSWIPTVGGGKCSCLPLMVMNPVIIDLDPKPLTSIHGRFAEEQSIAIQALEHCPHLVCAYL